MHWRYYRDNIDSGVSDTEGKIEVDAGTLPKTHTYGCFVVFLQKAPSRVTHYPGPTKSGPILTEVRRPYPWGNGREWVGGIQLLSSKDRKGQQKRLQEARRSPGGQGAAGRAKGCRARVGIPALGPWEVTGFRMHAQASAREGRVERQTEAWKVYGGCRFLVWRG